MNDAIVHSNNSVLLSKGIKKMWLAYHKSSTFARGLIAKLISKCWYNKKRLVVVNAIAKELGCENNIKQEYFIDGSTKEKKEWMITALRQKYEILEFKEILLET